MTSPADIHIPPEIDPDELTWLKVEVPASYRIRLHSLKIRGKGTVTQNVRRALGDYFAKLDKEPTSNE